MVCSVNTQISQTALVNLAADRLLTEYAENNSPIKVNFRTLIDWVPYGDRVTHNIHPYPAKLLPHIPYLFVNCAALSKKGDTVLDPFGGSGTVALEAILAERNAISFDCNPLACLIAKVKTTPISAERIERALEHIRETSLITKPETPDIVNINHWYSPGNIVELSKIRGAISTLDEQDTKDFFRICFSAVARKLSYADPRISVPVKLNPHKENLDLTIRTEIQKQIDWINSTNQLGLFTDQVKQNLVRINKLNRIESNATAKVHLNDSRGPSDVSKSGNKAKQVDLIITSPPYAGAQKYIRASGLALGWLDFAGAKGLRPLEKRVVGREHYSRTEYAHLAHTGIHAADSLLDEIFKEYPLRAHIAASYLNEMRTAITQMLTLLKKGGHVVMVVGNNRICGRDFITKEYLKEIFLQNKTDLILELVDDIKSRGLMTKRNKTAGMISSEWVMIFRKR